MINIKPVLALFIILIGFLTSISVAFSDMLGPNIPLPKKNIIEGFKTSYNSPLISTEENKALNSTRKSAELYLNQETLVHGYSNLNFNNNLSNIGKGHVTFLTVVCYGESENDCIYLNTYLKSFDSGDTWKLGFLE